MSRYFGFNGKNAAMFFIHLFYFKLKLTYACLKSVTGIGHPDFESNLFELFYYPCREFCIQRS